MKAQTALIVTSYFAHLGLCDSGGSAIGTATTYQAPYIPNKCYHGNSFQVPHSGLFAAVGPGLWDNGLICGQYYQIRCVEGLGVAGGKCTGKMITVKIVEGRLGRNAPEFSLSYVAAPMLYSGGGRFKVEYAEVRHP
uniref:Plant natriuretic peptide-like 4 n=1 Tax=Venturia pyrina TaxID=415593 RepID=A0A513ZS95_9PEZI|nr:plant natriuretic peptide-like 4 [Venturia pyrina]